MAKYSKNGMGLLRSIALPFAALSLSVFVINNTNFDIREKANSSTSSTFPRGATCSSVTVTGAQYGGIVNNKPLYFVNSGDRIVLAANTTPANSFVSWKVVTYSNLLQNKGTFSPKSGPTVTYRAPINRSGSDQGVEIRGDLSEYPDPAAYCPSFTVAIHSR